MAANLGPQSHDIAFGLRRDPYADGTAPVDIHQRRRRLDIPLLDAGDIAQTELPPVGGDEQLVGYILNRSVNARLQYAYLHLARHDTAAVDYGVLLRDRRHDHLGRDVEVGQCRHGDIEVYHGCLFGKQSDLLHTLHRNHIGLYALGPVADLAPRETVVGNQTVI